MKKLKGPELKMPELKVPAFLADLYYDLRDRRLLPVIGLAVVAIAAVPFLLGGDSEETYMPAPDAGSTALGPGTERSSRLTVVEATPGLRDYRRRLGDRSPANPFKQRYTGLPESAQVQSTATTSEVTSTGSSTVGVSEDGAPAPATAPPGDSGSDDGGSGAAGSGDGGGEAKPPRLIEFVVDLQISHTEIAADGTRKMGEPEVRQRVLPLTQLPGKKTPVVTTMGLNLRNGKIMFLASDEVKSLAGEFACVARTPAGVCELLEVEPGFVFELVYGPNKILYRFKVTKVDAIWAGRVGGGSRSSRAAFNGPFSASLPRP